MLSLTASPCGETDCIPLSVGYLWCNLCEVDRKLSDRYGSRSSFLVLSIIVSGKQPPRTMTFHNLFHIASSACMFHVQRKPRKRVRIVRLSPCVFEHYVVKARPQYVTVNRKASSSGHFKLQRISTLPYKQDFGWALEPFWLLLSEI